MFDEFCELSFRHLLQTSCSALFSSSPHASICCVFSRSLPLLVVSTKKQRFPLLYFFDHYGRIPKRFTFVDPVGNQFEVAVLERDTRIYLSDGSEIIGHFYGLTDGALLTLFCFNSSTFLMRVEDMNGNEIIYPTPPAKFALGDKHIPINISDDEGHSNQAPYKHDKANFYHSLFKTLSLADVSSGFLSLPLGFCQLAFAATRPAVRLVDENGKSWHCKLEWDPQPPFGCKLLGDWAKFCKKDGLKEGTPVKLGVSSDVCDVIYFELV